MLKKSSPKQALLIVLIGLGTLLTACSDRPGQIYDTANNPEKYPDMAVDLIRNIKSGELAGGPAIIDAFAQLYTEHSELLDQPSWTEIIKKLGATFAVTGDSLVTGGIANFTRAAEYYQLAAFALPNDATIREKTAAFECWYQVAQSPKVNLSSLTDNSEDIHAVLAALRPFALTDNPSYKFLQKYLTKPLKTRLQAAGQLEATVIDSLMPVDRALAAFCGLISTPPTEPLAQFENPPIDVVACRVQRTGDDYYSAEAYFIPHMDAPLRLTFGLEILTTDSSIVPVDLRTPVPRNEWDAGQLSAVGREFRFTQPVARISLGLVDATEKPARLVDVHDRIDGLWPLTIEVCPPADSLL